MNAIGVVIMFWALELTMIVGGLMLARSFDNNYKMIIQTYKEMVTLINEKDDAREKVYKAQLAAFDTMAKLLTTTNEQYETMSKAFDNMLQMYDRLIDCEKTLNAHYYILEERYSQIYDQFDECHRQLNDIRTLVEPKEDNDNNDGRV